MIDEPGCFQTNSQLSRTGLSRWADEGVEEARRKGSEARAKALEGKPASFLALAPSWGSFWIILTCLGTSATTQPCLWLALDEDGG